MIALSLALLLASEPDVVPLDENQRAPFAGLLFPPGRAEQLGVKLERCEFERDSGAMLCTQKEELRKNASDSILKIERDSCDAKTALVTEQLEHAREEARREVWEQPGIVLSFGILVGVAATVGAVFLLGELRPFVPAA